MNYTHLTHSIQQKIIRKQRKLFLFSLFLFVFFSFSVEKIGFADDLDDFEQARKAYDEQNFEKSIELFTELIGGDISRLRSKALIIESRKYLGAAYVFVGRNDLAKKEFAQIYDLDPEFELDSAQFPEEVFELFNAVFHEKTLEKLEKEKIEVKKEIAEKEYIIKEKRINSRLIAALPLGIGQFQNGSDSLGWFFLLSESLVAVANITLYIIHQDLLSQDLGFVIGPAPGEKTSKIQLNSEQKRYLDTEKTIRIANWLTFATLITLTLIGMTEAELSFKPWVEIKENEFNQKESFLIGFQYQF